MRGKASTKTVNPPDPALDANSRAVALLQAVKKGLEDPEVRAVIGGPLFQIARELGATPQQVVARASQPDVAPQASAAASQTALDEEDGDEMGHAAPLPLSNATAPSKQAGESSLSRTPQKEARLSGDAATAFVVSSAHRSVPRSPQAQAQQLMSPNPFQVLSDSEVEDNLTTENDPSPEQGSGGATSESQEEVANTPLSQQPPDSPLSPRQLAGRATPSRQPRQSLPSAPVISFSPVPPTPHTARGVGSDTPPAATQAVAQGAQRPAEGGSSGQFSGVGHPAAGGDRAVEAKGGHRSRQRARTGSSEAGSPIEAFSRAAGANADTRRPDQERKREDGKEAVAAGRNVFPRPHGELSSRVDSCNDDQTLAEVAKIVLEAYHNACKLPSVQGDRPRVGGITDRHITNDDGELYGKIIELHKRASALIGARVTGRPWKRFHGARRYLKKTIAILAGIQDASSQDAARVRSEEKVRLERLSRFREQLARPGGYQAGIEVLALYRLQEESPISDVNVTLVTVGVDGEATWFHADHSEGRSKRCFLFLTRTGCRDSKPGHWEPVGRRDSRGKTVFLFDTRPTSIPNGEEEDFRTDSVLQHVVAACKRRVLLQNRGPSDRLNKWRANFLESDDKSSEAQSFACADNGADNGVTPGDCWFGAWSKIIPEWSIQDQKAVLRELSEDPSHHLAVASEVLVADRTNVPDINDGQHEEKGDRRKPVGKKQGAGRSRNAAPSRSPTAAATSSSQHVADERKIIAWNVPRATVSATGIVEAAAARGVKVPKPVAVYVRAEARQHRYHHVLIFQSRADAEQALKVAGRANKSLGWIIRAFRSSWSSNRAAGQLLREAEARSHAVTDRQPRTERVRSPVQGGPPDGGDDADTEAPPESDGRDKLELARLKGLIEDLQKQIVALQQRQQQAVEQAPRFVVSVDAGPTEGRPTLGQQQSTPDDGRPPPAVGGQPQQKATQAGPDAHQSQSAGQSTSSAAAHTSQPTHQQADSFWHCSPWPSGPWQQPFAPQLAASWPPSLPWWQAGPWPSYTAQPVWCRWGTACRNGPNCRFLHAASTPQL